MPRIAHLITGLETGGAERMLLRLVNGIDVDRFPSMIISITGPEEVARELSKRGIPVRSLGIRRGLPDARMVPRLARLLRDFRPDVLQTWLYHADMLGLAVRELGLVDRLVWNLRCSDIGGPTLIRGVLRRFSAVPNAVVVNSSAGQAFHSGIGYRPRRWVHIPNGFDTDALAPSHGAREWARSLLGIPTDAIAVLLPARHHPMKDHATFLAAAAQLSANRPDVQFVMMGKGNEPTNRALAQMIETHGLQSRVTLAGERDDLETLYPAFDIVTLSSAFGEGFPNVLGEAMSSGVPCVGTAVGDVAAIIGEAGRVVPPRDSAALAAAWQQLVEMGPAERDALGAAARCRIARNWNIGSVVAQYETLYEQLEAETAGQRLGRAARLAYRLAVR